MTRDIGKFADDKKRARLIWLVNDAAVLRVGQNSLHEEFSKQMTQFNMDERSIQSVAENTF